MTKSFLYRGRGNFEQEILIISVSFHLAGWVAKKHFFRKFKWEYGGNFDKNQLEIKPLDGISYENSNIECICYHLINSVLCI